MYHNKEHLKKTLITFARADAAGERTSGSTNRNGYAGLETRMPRKSGRGDLRRDLDQERIDGTPGGTLCGSRSVAEKKLRRKPKPFDRIISYT